MHLQHEPGSLPGQRAASLIFDHSRLEEVAFLLQVDHFAHPRERVFLVRVQRIETDLLATAVADEAQIALEHRRVEAEHPARHRVFRVTIFEFDRLLEDLADVRAELSRPELRVFEFDLVDQVDAEIAVHRLVAQDVLVLFRRAGHLVSDGRAPGFA